MPIVHALSLPLQRLMLATALIAGPAGAAVEAPAPRIVLSLHKVVAHPERGGAVREALETLDGLRPGDVVEYVAVCTNPGTTTVRDLRVTLPVPPGGLAFAGVAPNGPAPSGASTDGRTFGAFPLTRPARSADGRAIVERVPFADYRALRWTVGEIPAGAERTVRARMTLRADGPEDGPRTAAAPSVASSVAPSVAPAVAPAVANLSPASTGRSVP